MQDKTLSMFSEVTSTSLTATSTSPKNKIMIKDSGVAIQKSKGFRTETFKRINLYFLKLQW